MTDVVAKALTDLQFDNRFVDSLPGDTEPRNFQRQVQAALFSRVVPTPVSQPRLIASSREVMELLKLHPDIVKQKIFADVFAGNKTLPGMESYATNYGGHQFGHWAGQLGDGRAINLGEVEGLGAQHFTLQLKGAGPTPYSRGADGRAVLRSSIREFLCSEAMHHLGVPTTRALSLTLTGDTVIRDMFYDGHPVAEPGAIVCRVAPSFTRFGHFQLLAYRGEHELLQRLLNFTIDADYPELLPAKKLASLSSQSQQKIYLRWFEEVCRRTITMIVHWQRVGFVHGVMNTDNMSILGLTIDYGPYGWVDDYNPNWTPNTTDAEQRRYRFGQQPAIARWNLYQLANAILPLFENAEALTAILDQYADWYQAEWGQMMAAKLGLPEFNPGKDIALFEALERLLTVCETDMSIFFRKLAYFDPENPDERLIDTVSEAFYKPPLPPDDRDIRKHYEQWEHDYRERLLGAKTGQFGVQSAEQLSIQSVALKQARIASMNQVNPCYVLRNYLAQNAIDKAEQGDFEEITRLHEVLRSPYTEQPGHEAYAAKRPDWARSKPGCSMLSCSS